VETVAIDILVELTVFILVPERCVDHAKLGVDGRVLGKVTDVQDVRLGCDGIGGSAAKVFQPEI
jgi:hypothetical protein